MDCFLWRWREEEVDVCVGSGGESDEVVREAVEHLDVSCGAVVSCERRLEDFGM